MNDIFYQSYENYIRWGGEIPEMKLVTLMRILFIFSIASLIYYWTFFTKRRKAFVRILLLVIGIGLILSFQIRLPESSVLRSWILTLSVIISFGLPSVLPFFIVPEAGRQPRVKTILYAILAVLLLIGMLYT